jgi:antitoxin YefM
MTAENAKEKGQSYIEETLFLSSIPGMRESILEGMREPLAESVTDLGW